jgi:hypothetical protein
LARDGIEHLPLGDKRRASVKKGVLALERRFCGSVLSLSDKIVLGWGAISGEVKRLTGHSPSVIDTMDFLAAAVPDGPFHFVFDRGCFHVFDEPAERAQFAERVAATLAPEGLWLSLIGSTEGPPREMGPPRRTAQEITRAIEPALEIVELRAAEFRGHGAQA